MKKHILKQIVLLTFLVLTLVPFALLTLSNTSFNVFNSPISVPKDEDVSQSAWTSNGNILCNAINDQGSLSGVTVMCSDGAGGAIITWTDGRDGENDIYAQRVLDNGSVLWDLNGIAISNTTDLEFYQQIISDGLGGAIIVYERYISGTTDVYAQRIDSDGNKLWGANGIAVSSASSSQSVPKLCSDGNGGAIITWEDDRTENPPYNAHDIYTQWVNRTGHAKWTADGVVICNASYAGDHADPDICSDGNGGAIIVWRDNRTSGDTDDVYNIYAQKINSSGLTEWTPNGTVICNYYYEEENPKLVSDEQGGAIIS